MLKLQKQNEFIMEMREIWFLFSAKKNRFFFSYSTKFIYLNVYFIFFLDKEEENQIFMYKFAK